MKRKTDYREKYLREARAWKSANDRLRQTTTAYYSLKAKYDVAIERLQDVASGFHPLDMSSSWSFESKLKMSAAQTLKKLATMPQEKLP